MVTHKIILGLIITSMSLVLWSCVDVPSEGFVPPDPRTMVRIVNVGSDIGSSAIVTIDGSSVGNLAFGASTGYLDVGGGGRMFSFAGSTAEKVLFESARQYTVVITPDALSRYLTLHEGYVSVNNGKPGVAIVRFVNIAKGSAANISFRDGNALGSTMAGNVAYGSNPQYTNVPPGIHQIYVVSAEGSATIDGDQEVPAPITTTSSGSGRFSLGLLTGLSYKISLTSDNSQGLYTAGYIQNAASGSNGPQMYPIDLSVQKISFPSTNLSGENETPPETTTASGTGTFTFTKEGLSYSITVASEGVGDTLTAGHFQNGAEGATGSIVYTLTTSSIVGSQTISGLWPAGENGDSLTSALVTELLEGRIYVNFISVARSSGAIRAQLAPNPSTTNEFVGIWNDASLTESIRNAYSASELYVNFTTTADAGGQIRGQILVDTTGGARPGAAALEGTTFEAGRMYTVIATGADSTLQLHLLNDRQPGLARTSNTSSIRQNNK